MKPCRSRLALLLLGFATITCANALSDVQVAASPDIQWVAQGSTHGNTNNTLRRINPNSRQGSVPATPVPPAPSTMPRVKAPTLENGGVGNGYPRNPPLPETVKPTAPSLQPRDNR